MVFIASSSFSPFGVTESRAKLEYVSLLHKLLNQWANAPSLSPFYFPEKRFDIYSATATKKEKADVRESPWKVRWSNPSKILLKWWFIKMEMFLSKMCFKFVFIIICITQIKLWLKSDILWRLKGKVYHIMYYLYCF